MKFLFKYPTKNRPEWFISTLTIYVNMLSGLHDYHFIISIDDDDETMNNNAMQKFFFDLIQRSDKNITGEIITGNHKTKIEAVNADVSDVDFDILFLISDDMIPQIDNFDDAIANHMLTYFPECDGALHYNDGYCGKDQCITLSIMGKKLYDYFGYIYHPSYNSFFCDNEFTDEVRRLNKVKYISDVIIKHVWKGGRHEADDLYRLNSAKGKPDEKTYNKRKQLGFPRLNEKVKNVHSA